jgi:hypothetical protein
MKITSRAQQGFFGAVASGQARKSGLSPAKATKMLRENKGQMRALPARAPERPAIRRPSRTPSRRGGR